MQKTMVVMMISELNSVSRLKIFLPPETRPLAYNALSPKGGIKPSLESWTCLLTLLSVSLNPLPVFVVFSLAIYVEATPKPCD